MHAVLTKLSRPFAIHRHVCPVIGPIDFPRFAQRQNGFDCECHPRFAHSGHLTVGIMRDPGRGVEFGVDTMATPGRVDATVSGLGMLLDDLAKVSEEGARLHELDCHIQALSGRFHHSDRVRIRLGSITHVIRFVHVSVVTTVIY